MVAHTAEHAGNTARFLLRLLSPLWRDARIGVAAAVGAAVLSGLFVGLAMPYGPATAAQTLAAIGSCFIVGLFAGAAMRSRWAVALAPLAHMAALELARIDAVGPTVDAVRLDEMWGIVAFILGRGFYAIVGLAPMMLGAIHGAALARADAPSRSAWRTVRRGATALATVGVLALAAAFALPARTPAIVGADGKPLPGSIAALEQVRLGGHDQWILMRGHSVDKPVLLYLSGGPGQSDLAWPPVMFRDMERDFVVVCWDQRGTGKSYAALAPASTLTLDQAIADTIELADYLRQRFDEQKIYVLGESWGTTLGVLAAQRRPDLYHAFIGSGQMVSQRETDRRLYHDVLALAERTGDRALAEKMQSYGEPPYKGIWGNAFVMAYYDALSEQYTPPQSYIERGSASGVGPLGTMVSEYNLVENVNVLRGLMDMFAVMYPQIQDVDFRRDVTRLDVPVYVLDAAHELTSRRDLALEWFAMLQSPRKQIFTFENAGHAVAFEQFEAFHKLMTETIVPETYRRGGQ